ncbi:MAG: tRNA adenosine(34) deaminase TadA [Mariprofundaceae bacterium]|nr:tRNA adenosine(34) deaminase TadA [Mariprofundaceae bacterium]
MMLSDEEYMQLALAQASLAAEMGEVPVGAVLVLADGQQFEAHNAPISLHDPSAHAEIQVIRKACNAMCNYRLLDARLFVTLEPCIMCAGAIIHARIKAVSYGASEPKTGAVESLYTLLSDNRLNHQTEVHGGVLAEQCSAQIKTFFKARRRCIQHSVAKT